MCGKLARGWPDFIKIWRLVINYGRNRESVRVVSCVTSKAAYESWTMTYCPRICAAFDGIHATSKEANEK